MSNFVGRIYEDEDDFIFEPFPVGAIVEVDRYGDASVFIDANPFAEAGLIRLVL